MLTTFSEMLMKGKSCLVPYSEYFRNCYTDILIRITCRCASFWPKGKRVIIVVVVVVVVFGQLKVLSKL